MSHIEGLRVAMLGTTDGDFIDPDSDIPAGEMFRLAAEYLESVLPDSWEFGLADGAGMLYGPADEATVRARQEQIIMPLRLMRRRPAGDWEVVREPDDVAPGGAS